MEGQGADALEALRVAERETFRKIQESTPERVARPTLPEPEEIHARIGIAGVRPGPKGYIRAFPHDFIVEEVGADGSVSTVDPEEPSGDLDAAQPTLYADIVKCGIGTLEAVAHLSNALGIPPTAIGYAGMKDGRALTSQRMSLRHGDWTGIVGRRFSQLFMKPKATGKGALAIGQLRGNRFTILVRTEEPVDPTALSGAVQSLATNGFANFFGPQRFGNRLLNPELGRLLCRGDADGAVRLFLTASGPFDIPLYQEIRASAAERYGDWVAMAEAFGVLPYTFRHERALLAALAEQGGAAAAALAAIADQVRFWVYGYAGYLVNQVLSGALTRGGELPDPLPVPLGGESTDRLYQQSLDVDGTNNYWQQLRAWPFLLLKRRTMPPWIFPEVHGVVGVPPGAVLSFTLPKAAYATTFLLFLFRLYEGSPVPLWVRSDPVDAKAVLGTGSAEAALSVLNLALGVEDGASADVAESE